MVVQSVESLLKRGVQSLYDGDAKALEASIQRVTDRSREVQGRLHAAIKAYLRGNGTGSGSVEKLSPVGLEAATAILFPSKPVKGFNDLTFEEYKELLLSHKDRPKLDHSTDPKELRHLLTRVRDIRNKLAHFRGDLDAEERGVIRFAAAWLERRSPEVAAAALSTTLGKEFAPAATPAEAQ